MAEPRNAKYRPLPGRKQSEWIIEDREELLRPSSSDGLRAVRSVFGKVLLIVAYTILLSALVSSWWRQKLIHGAGVVDSPLRSSIRYEPTFFQRGWSTKYTLMGPPNPEIDGAWEDLMQSKCRLLTKQSNQLQCPNNMC